MNIRSVSMLAILPVISISCYSPRYMYNPSAQNVPVLVKKGDSKLSAYYSTDLNGGILDGSSPQGRRENSSGFDLQGAVALTNNFAIQAGYFNRTEWNKETGTNAAAVTINYKRNLAEIGLGYFTSMNRRDKVLFQVFGGIGKGTSSFTDQGRDVNNSFYLRYHQADVLKVYVQPAFVFRLKENFAMSVSTRMSFINFRNIRTNYTEAELQNYLLNDLPYGYRTFWEPAFTNSFGFKKLRGVKFEYQLSTSLLVSDRTLDYRSLNFSLGAILDVSKLIRGQPEFKNE